MRNQIARLLAKPMFQKSTRQLSTDLPGLLIHAQNLIGTEREAQERCVAAVLRRRAIYPSVRAGSASGRIWLDFTARRSRRAPCRSPG